MTTLPFAEILSERGQDMIRSADFVFVCVEGTDDVFCVCGGSRVRHSAPGTPPDEKNGVEIVVPSTNDVEQVRLAAARAGRHVADKGQVQKMGASAHS